MLEPLSLFEFIKQAVSVSSLPRTEIRCDDVAALVAIRGDKRRLARVIANLIDNARIHSSGKPKIVIQLADEEPPTTNVWIIVEDDGDGLIEGEFNKGLSDQLLQGVKLEDGLARALKVVHIRAVTKNHHWVEITIHEGRYHIIRRLIESLGTKVLRLIRLEFGPIALGDMKVGRHRVLNSQEMTNLFNLLSIKQ